MRKMKSKKSLVDRPDVFWTFFWTSSDFFQMLPRGTTFKCASQQGAAPTVTS
jgi:hypothetical protein